MYAAVPVRWQAAGPPPAKTLMQTMGMMGTVRMMRAMKAEEMMKDR